MVNKTYTHKAQRQWHRNLYRDVKARWNWYTELFSYLNRMSIRVCVQVLGPFGFRGKIIRKISFTRYTRYSDTNPWAILALFCGDLMANCALNQNGCEQEASRFIYLHEILLTRDIHLWAVSFSLPSSAPTCSRTLWHPHFYSCFRFRIVASANLTHRWWRTASRVCALFITNMRGISNLRS